MYRFYAIFCVFLFLVYGCWSTEVNNGAETQIKCNTKVESMVLWFRVKKDKIEFIASYTNGVKKSQNEEVDNKFTDGNIKSHSLTLKGFDKERDSGVYSCVSINNNQLHFGELTTLTGPPDPEPTKKPVISTQPAQDVPTKTTASCSSPNNVKLQLMGCDLMILLPLTVGCGLLLIFLIFTILYCSHTRTRYCPHHYKKRPQKRTAGHNALPNQHVF